CLVGELTESRASNESSPNPCTLLTSCGEILLLFRSSFFLRKHRKRPRPFTKRFATSNRTCRTLSASLTGPAVEPVICLPIWSNAFNTQRSSTRSLTLLASATMKRRSKRSFFDMPALPSEIFLRLGVTGRLELHTTNRGTRFNTQSIWSNSFADSTNPALIQTVAGSGSGWQGSLKDIPLRRIGCSKWITSKQK